jgi:O-antigen/teichoic acid export membrane protein
VANTGTKGVPERSKHSRSILSTVASNIASPAAAIVTGPLLARTLGVAGRGDYASVIAPTNLALLLFMVGTPNTITYFVAKRQIAITRARNLSLAFGLTTGVLATVAVWLLAPVLLRHDRQYIGLTRVTSLLLIPAATAAVIRGLHQGLGDFQRLNRERWLGTAVRLALLASFAAFGYLTVRSASWITLASVVAASAILIRGLRREPAGRSLDAYEPSTKTILRYSGLVAIGAVSGSVIIRLDQAIMPVLSSVHQLAYYAVAVSVAEVPIVVSTAVRDVVFTVSTERSSPELVAEAARLVLLLQLGVALVLAPLMLWLVPFAFGADFRAAVAPTEILLLAGALLGQNSPAVRSAAQVGAAIVTVLALVLLVPFLGAIGASVASLLAYAFSSTANAWLLARLSTVTFSSCLIPRATDFRSLRLRIANALPSLR